MESEQPRFIQVGENVEHKNESVTTGLRVSKKKKTPLIVLASLLALLVVTLILLFINKRQSAERGDRKDMNLHGNVIRLVEKSTYTGDGMENESIEGGLFDDASFLSVVYSDEHIARTFYKKWFLYQVSDCEIQFDKYGNIIMIKSIWDEGGEVHFKYDGNHRMIEMDGRDPAGNQDEGVVRYSYVLSNNVVVEEEVNQESDWGKQFTVKYQYDAYNNLSRAVMETRWGNYIFSYKDAQLTDIYFADYWREGVPAEFKIEYDTNGNISKVTATGKKGYSESARVTSFEYSNYDSHGNWMMRKGRVVFANGEEFQIETTRQLDYR